MKFKQHIYITDPLLFLSGSYNCFILCANDNVPDGWVLAGETEFEIDVETMKVRDSAVASLDAEIKKERAEHNVKMDLLQGKINDLLCIEHQAA